MADLQRCQGPECAVEFEPKRSTARYCSATCRQRAGRRRKAADAETEAAKDDGTEKEHGLVRAVRLELTKAQAMDTVAGQLALAAARRIANPDEAGFATMSKELRSLLAEAKAGAAPDPSAPPAATAEPEEDEVSKARRQREEIAAAAASAEAGA